MCHLDIVVVKKLWQTQRPPVTAARRGEEKMSHMCVSVCVCVCVCVRERQREVVKEQECLM